MTERRITALSVLGLAGLLLTAVLAGPLHAQTISNSFGGLSKNSDKPIDIASDLLTVNDAKKLAIFKGNVKAVQGTTILKAAQLDVHYVGSAGKLTGKDDEKEPPVESAAAQPAGGDPRSSIKKIEARGNVVITSEDDQTTTSDWAIYDVPGQLVTVGGNVVLSQDQNVLKGNRLIIDLKTGESRFDNTGTAATGSGRIRALFMPKGSKPQDEDKSKNKKKKGRGSKENASANTFETEPKPSQVIPGTPVDPGAPPPSPPVQVYR